MSKIAPSDERKLTGLIIKNLFWRANQLGLYSELDIADRIGMERSTLHRRKVDPATWKLIEITRAAVALGTTLEWLCIDHSKECKKGA